jgi:transcriptional regulator with XRE-family HTH domain
MSLQQAIKLRVLELCKENNLTINGLAMLSGMSQSTVNSLVDGTSQNPKLLTILRLCLGLEIEIKDFFDSDIFVGLED